jgi:hypothetical protein
MTMIKKYLILCCVVPLLGLSGCFDSPEVVSQMEQPSYVIEEIADVEGFGAFYASLEAALFEKEWGQLFNAISEKDRKYFDGERDFVTYMEGKNRLWKLNQLDELSSEEEYNEIGVQQIKIYFEAKILPGPTQHYGSLDFFRENGKWTVSGLERLGLSRVKFEY